MKQIEALDPRADTIQRIALIAGAVGLILWRSLERSPTRLRSSNRT